MNKITLELNTVNVILQYLSGRPYNEVYPLIEKIKQEAASNEVNIEEVETETRDDKTDKKNR